jgi:hypothetical protein
MTSASPSAPGADVATVPETVVSKGAVGMPEFAGEAVEGVLDVGAEEYDAEADPDNWARRAEEVPDRRDQPDRSGPAAANAVITTSTAAPATAPPSRQDTERAHPAARRQATAAVTAAVQTTNTSIAPGRRGSEPEPKPWTTAMGQQA